MAHKPPIDRQALKGKEVMSPVRFFKLLSEKCNYIDQETAQRFYMGLVKLISQELRENGIVRLPHLGDLALVKSPPRSMFAGRGRKVIEGMYMLKFYANNKFREYFSKLSQQKGELDPREKILKRDL